MKIKYFGHSYLLIEGGEYSIALDPFGDIGLNIPTVKADYVFSSHSHYDHNNISVVKGAIPILKSVGAFTILPSFHDNEKGKLRGENNILLFKLDGYNIAFMGDYGEEDNDYIASKLFGVDILFIPIGGKYTIDAKTAKRYVDKIQLNPNALILLDEIEKAHPSVINLFLQALDEGLIKSSNNDIKGVNDFLSLVSGFKNVNSPYEYNNEKGVVVVAHNI